MQDIETAQVWEYQAKIASVSVTPHENWISEIVMNCLYRKARQAPSMIRERFEAWVGSKSGEA